MPGRMQSALSSAPAVALTKTVLTVFNFIFWVSVFENKFAAFKKIEGKIAFKKIEDILLYLIVA